MLRIQIKSQQHNYISIRFFQLFSCSKCNVKFLYTCTCSCHRQIFQTLTSLEFLDKVSCDLFLAVQFLFLPLFCRFFAIWDIVKHRDTHVSVPVTLKLKAIHCKLLHYLQETIRKLEFGTF